LLTVTWKGMQAQAESDCDTALVALTKGRAIVEKFLLSTHGRHSRGTWAEYFKEEAQSLIKDKSISYRARKSKSLDIIQDVINILPIRWVSEEIIGLPLKTETNQHGTWYEQDAYKKFANVGRYVFLNFDPADDWHLRVDSIDAFSDVFEFTKRHLAGYESLKDISVESDHSRHFLRRVTMAFKDQHTPIEELSAYVFAAVVPTCAHFSQAIAHVVDFYLDEDKQQERGEIVELSASVGQKQDSVKKIMAYVREALRINPPVSGVYRTAAQDVLVPGYSTIEAGDRVFLSLIDANRDPAIFGDDPAIAVYDRPQAALLGLGEHGLLSSTFFESTVPTILGTLLGLKNIRRAAGDSGKLAKFTEKWHGSPRQLYINTKGDVTPFPDSLFVEFDD